MKEKRNLGLWLDDLVAHFIEYRSERTIFENVVSQYGIYQRELQHDRRKKFKIAFNWLGEYFKNLKDRIGTYDRVILFGPKKIKQMLYKQLRSDRKFSKVDIKVDSGSDSTKMSDKQMDDFVRNYFTK